MSEEFVQDSFYPIDNNGSAVADSTTDSLCSPSGKDNTRSSVSAVFKTPPSTKLLTVPSSRKVNRSSTPTSVTSVSDPSIGYFAFVFSSRLSSIMLFLCLDCEPQKSILS